MRTLLPDSESQRRTLVLFFGDTSFELLDDKNVALFDPARPKQHADPKKKEISRAVKDALDRAKALRLVSGRPCSCFRSFHCLNLNRWTFRGRG